MTALLDLLLLGLDLAVATAIVFVLLTLLFYYGLRDWDPYPLTALEEVLDEERRRG